ncbi:14293_t:CDS:2, partial [Acaulospora colombiana]
MSQYMKRFFPFQNKPKNSTKPQPILVTTKPPKSTNPSETSPTLAKRPTARNENEVWQSLQVIATEDALLIRPVHDAHCGHLKLNWGVSASVLSVDDDRNDLDWDASSLPIHGIVGTTTLTHSEQYGNFDFIRLIHPTSVICARHYCVNSSSRQVYGLKAAVAIPLEYTRAANVINNLVAQIKKQNNTDVLSNNDGAAVTGEIGSLHVKWATQHFPTITPDATLVLSSSPTSSGHLTPPPNALAIAPLAKTIADRLSFWKSRRTASLDEDSLIASKASGHHETLGELLEDIDNGDTANIEPERAIDDIITAAAAPEPHSAEQKNLVLEDKIMKEIIRQFIKGGMYFSYTFVDLSNSLQRKQQQVERLKKRESILSDLDALGDWSNLEICEDAQPFKEPLVNLPLWRRIDRRFWWNEHMSQSLVEAELHAYVLPILQGYFQIASIPVPDSDETQDTPTAGTGSDTETITEKPQSTIEPG